MSPILGGLPGKLVATVTGPGARDQFGDLTGGASSPWLVEGCLLAPSTTVENTDRAERIGTTWDLYAPASGSFPPGATVEVGGITGRVEGTAKAWSTAGQVVVLTRVTG